LGFLGKAIPFLLEWGARVAAVLALLYSLYLITLQNYWVAPLGDVSPFSLGSASVLYLLSQYKFSRDGWGRVDSMALGVLFANAFLQTYEIVYHFTFPIYSLSFPFIQGSDLRFLIVTLAMVVPLVIMRKDLSFRRSSAYVLVAFALSILVWVLFGFPQYFSSTYYIPPVLHTSDPYRLSLLLNYVSKVILACFFITLLNVWKRGPASVWGRTARAAQPSPAPRFPLEFKATSGRESTDGTWPSK